MIEFRSRLADTGSAAVEFVLVAPLVLIVFAAVVQVGLAAHVRATLIASAAEGARAGAESGSLDQAALRQTQAALASSVASDVVREIKVDEQRIRGLPVVAVTIRARLPLFGLLGPSNLVVTGRALREGAA